MDDSRGHPRVRKISLLLSSLALTPDAGLEAFRDRRAADPKVGLDKLKQARAILDAVGQAIDSTDAGRWGRLARAFELLEKDAVVVDATVEPKPAAKPSKPPEAAAAPTPIAMPPAKPVPLAMPVPSAPKPIAMPPVAMPAPIAMPPVAMPAPIAMPSPPAAIPPPPLLGPAAPPAPVSDAPELEGTLSIGDGPIDPTVLPFRGGVAPLPPSASNEPPHKAIGRTGLNKAYVPEEPLPFRSDAPAAAPAAAGSPVALDVQQYASFCVERELYPERADEVRSRYGVRDAIEEMALDARWRGQLDADPAARSELDQKRRAYREWLLTRR